ncbi:hypothetical protein E2C01_070047 [Portunus trituberculatus]|uniref:Uncharacterized protein n=1 Tax=Portunus trituberculatus TaxID=210409 RepID=A0A5B7I4E4_PORTR|nr:hypothetical protein [Portunus trituberculatus]
MEDCRKGVSEYISLFENGQPAQRRWKRESACVVRCFELSFLHETKEHTLKTTHAYFDSNSG